MAQGVLNTKLIIQLNLELENSRYTYGLKETFSFNCNLRCLWVFVQILEKYDQNLILK